MLVIYSSSCIISYDQWSIRGKFNRMKTGKKKVGREEASGWKIDKNQYRVGNDLEGECEEVAAGTH